VDITWVASPHFDQGRTDRAGNRNSVELIVLHYMVGTLTDTDAHFADPASEVSTHYGIGEGAVHQYVTEEDTAWHAGDFTINTRSIGIEHSAFWNPDTGEIRPPEASTLEASIELCTRICRDYGLDPATDIVPHRQFTSTACPGTLDYLYIRKRVRKNLL
jgi:N-acetyl-anhydromuramyl-L-alanine amidase AmpD